MSLGKKSELYASIEDTPHSDAMRKSWFDMNADDKPLLQNARQAIEGREQFRNSLHSLLKGHSLHTSREALDLEVQKLLQSENPQISELKHAASAGLSGAKWALNDYNNKRAAGWRKSSASAQRFLTAFADFFGAYSAFVDLLKSADPVFGPAAYEALSIFLIVVLSKSGNDNKITDLLHEITRSFPHLDTWLDLYPTQQMKKAVVEVYKHIIEFTRHTSRYFTRFKTRIGMAVGKPPSIGIDRTIVTIQGSLAEANSQAMVHLHQRISSTYDETRETSNKIDDLKRENGNLQSYLDAIMRANERLEKINADLKKSMEEQRRREAEQKLDTLKHRFGIELPHNECNLDMWRQNHIKAFDPQDKSPIRSSNKHRFTQMTCELLESQLCFVDWQACETSAMLVLSGRTIPESRRRGFIHSWLSRAAILVTEQMQEQDKVVAFFTCNPGYRAERYPTKRLFQSIACQIMSQKPLVIEKVYARLDGALDGLIQTPNQDIELEILVELLKQILCKFDGCVNIVLDYIDHCTHSLATIMKKLIELTLVKDAHVKVLVVLDGINDWDMESALERSSDRVRARQRVYANVNWDQEREGLTNVQPSRLGV